MTDFIRREDAKTLVHDRAIEMALNNVGFKADASDILEHISKRSKDWIDEIPTADVRPVVLCRDCVYYNTTGCADGFGWCEGVMVSKGTSDDFFCAEGKQNPYECGAEMERNLDTTKGDDHD